MTSNITETPVATTTTAIAIEVRRNLNVSQRCMIAARLANMPQGTRTDLASKETMSQATAAKMLNVSRRGVQRAREVLDTGTPELIEAVDQGKCAVTLAAKMARERARAGVSR